MRSFTAVLAVLLGGCLQLAASTSSIDCSGTEIHELVVKYDVDGSGAINSSELLTMCLNLGLPLLSDEATGVVSKYGGNSGELTDAQLCNYLNTLLTADETEETTAEESTDSSRSSSRGKGKGKNFVETFNPTPENLKRRLKKHAHETYNPTPGNLHPTKKPSQERRLKLKLRGATA